MKQIIFIDIDGTLLDSHYRANSNDVADYVARLQKKGVVFALNSNRAFEDMVPVAKQFGIDGPLIAENGMFYATAHDEEQNLLLSLQAAQKIRQTKLDFEQELKSLLDKKYGDRYLWVEADTVELLSQEQPSIGAQIGSLVFVNNKYRTYTTSVHVFRQTKDGLSQVPPETVDAICAEMSPWADGNGFTVTHGHEFANILGYTTYTSKYAAAQELKKVYADIQFAAIGNEYYDAQMIDGIGVFYAVANATDEAKRAAAYIATNSTTLGVVEVLHMIEEQLNGAN